MVRQSCAESFGGDGVVDAIVPPPPPVGMMRAVAGNVRYVEAIAWSGGGGGTRMVEIMEAIDSMRTEVDYLKCCYGDAAGWD